MQYHLNGFNPGDPSIAVSANENIKRAQNVDVLIIGCGPAGLTLAAQLSAFPEHSVRIVERKPGPLDVGQADGIACRSMEMFEAFGFAEKVLKESYWVNEVAFWRPELNGAGLHRADLIPDVEDDLSEMPHVILNQARVHDFYLEKMLASPLRLTPDYQRELVSLQRTDDVNYPIKATFNCENVDNKTDVIQARFVVGCDGARSTVREHMGQKLKGESARQLWGVMDILAVTDFPDIRKKVAIQSANSGSLLIIPREGGYMVRMYIELDELHGTERASDRQVSSAKLIEKACAILAPYTLDVKEVVWWSAYEIGQRVCDSFDNVANHNRDSQTPDIFIAGDACHTHSPKAGQGMNVGMADAFNLGWKLAAVLSSHASPALLHTYSLERQAKARELIDFDKDMARLFSAKPKDATEAAQFQQYFKKHGRYTAGVETQYDTSLITASNEHQALATGQIVGRRFHSDKVIRLSDARQIQLGHTLKADGRWRFIVFADDNDTGQSDSPVAHLCSYLHKHPNSPIVRYTPANDAIDSVFDIRVVFQIAHHKLAIETMPPLLLPTKGKLKLIDYEKIFSAVSIDSQNIFNRRGIDRARGALVVVRPDQYISAVLPLGDYDNLSSFFHSFMIEPNSSASER